ncbi:MAG TPA: OB-fold nucleic acid binding domain-containing protein [Candidatus Omnitrophota bacterium]|nr:OB-fold nucleic acid binding domain-containing protein [Candidatus Omnitrophota bacterium]
MPDTNFKRNIAYKLRIGDLLVGKPISENERFSFLELGDRRIIRVNVIGNVIEKYNSAGEKRYSFMTIDDGSGQIKLKAFGDDVAKLENFNQGETIIVIGTLRQFNDEVYISPEIVKVQEPKYLLVRKIEIEKSAPVVVLQAGKGAIRDRILNDIKNSENDGGIFVDALIMSHRDTSADIINQEVQRLLEEGIIFEPRPGKVRYLG